MSPNQEQSRDESFMMLALKLAAMGLGTGELPIGAILVLKNEVIAEAYCSEKRQRMLDHPELAAFLQADMKYPTLEKRRQMTLYTNLEPCVMCLGAAMSFGVGRIVFGAHAPADGAVGRLSSISFGNPTYPDYRVPPVTGSVLKADSLSLFQTFIETSQDGPLIIFARGILDADSSTLMCSDSASARS